MSLLQFELLLLAALSFVISRLIVAHGDRVSVNDRSANDLQAVQAMHFRKTPRLGGVAVFAALGLSAFLRRNVFRSPTCNLSSRRPSCSLSDCLRIWDSISRQ